MYLSVPDVTRLLLYAAQASHDLVPPEVSEIIGVSKHLSLFLYRALVKLSHVS